MVSDYEALFKQVTETVCNRTMTFHITAAAEGVADGIVVDTTVKVYDHFVHRIKCD